MIFFAALILEIVSLFVLSQILTKSLSKVFLIITKSQKSAIGIMAILFFPGVVVHELSHLITAGVLFVRTGEIEFLPKIEGERVKLGSVSIEKTDPVRRAIIGFAPVLVGLASIMGLIYLLIDNSSIVQAIEPKTILGILIRALIFYLLFVVSNTMFSSRKDLEGTIELLIVLLVIFAVFYLIGFRIDITIPSIIKEGIIEFIKKASLFLLIPIGIDIFIVSLLNCSIVKGLWCFRR